MKGGLLTQKKTRSIDTLLKDIQDLMVQGKSISEEDADKFGKSVAETIKTKLSPESRQKKGTLRMSNVGKPARQLWYEVNMPEKAEQLHANAYMKFLVGDLLEEVILFLAEQSGHKVEGQQQEVELNGVKGHIDSLIDGTLVDVKSASPYSFKKFEDGLTADKDAFGYRGQIQGYLEALQDDPKLVSKDRGAFLAVQKVTGDLALDVHEKSHAPIGDIIEYKKQVVAQPEPPEEKCYEPEPMGKSGNMKLGIQCSYCPFKKECWPEMRIFLYSTGPVFLTEVVEEPRVPELKDEENGLE